MATSNTETGREISDSTQRNTGARKYAAAVIAGTLCIDTVPAELLQRVQDMLVFPAYIAARRVLDMPNKEARAEALRKIPSTFRPIVEIKARELFTLRK